MKIVLTNLPWKDAGRLGVRAGSRWPHLKGRHEWAYLPFPFFLAYAASLLKEHGFDITLIDAIAEGMKYEAFIDAIQDIGPDLLVCETSTVTMRHDLVLLEKISKYAPVAICGPDVNVRHPLFLKQHNFISYVLAGEYEFTLLELAGCLSRGNGLESVLGLIYRDAQGVRINPPRPLADLDSLPWPMRDGLPMEQYNDAPGNMPLPSVQMMASRGCPYSCKFCLWPQVMYQANNYRVRGVVDVIDEMEYVLKRMNFKSVYFDDDTFNCGKERMLKISAEIKRRQLNAPWAIMARPDLMDEEILESMKSAGLYAVKYGVESASQELLDRADKKMNIKKAEEMIRLTKKLDIKTHLTFTFGLPGETKESIRKTLDLALRLDPFSVQFSIVTPFPGTVFYQEMESTGRISSKDWREYDGNRKSVISYEHLSNRDLEHALRHAYKQWACHCTKRICREEKDTLGAYYYRLCRESIKKHGIITTGCKIFGFVVRLAGILLQKKLEDAKRNREEKGYSESMTVGRLELAFGNDSVGIYWGGVPLTMGEGFSTCLAVINGQGQLRQEFSTLHSYEQLGENKLQLKRTCGPLPLEESWVFEILDEKQIDWRVSVVVKKEIEIAEANVALLASDKYITWMDAWGDGRFYPIHEFKEVRLRNPGTPFIGVRGRRNVKLKLPTVLLDLMGADNGFRPCIRNYSRLLGARMLEIKIKHGGKKKYAPGNYQLFLGRIKIVEERSARKEPAFYKQK